MKPQRLDLDSEALEEFRQCFNAALEIVTCQLSRKKMMEGVVDAKIKIQLAERADDKTGEIYYMMELEPDVKMKIGSNDKIKCGRRGGIIMKHDLNGRPMIASQQIEMEDLIGDGASA